MNKKSDLNVMITFVLKIFFILTSIPSCANKISTISFSFAAAATFNAVSFKKIG